MSASIQRSELLASTSQDKSLAGDRGEPLLTVASGTTEGRPFDAYQRALASIRANHPALLHIPPIAVPIQQGGYWFSRKGERPTKITELPSRVDVLRFWTQDSTLARRAAFALASASPDVTMAARNIDRWLSGSKARGLVCGSPATDHSLAVLERIAAEVRRSKTTRTLVLVSNGLALQRIRSRLTYLHRDSRARDLSFRDTRLINESPITVATFEDFERLAEMSNPFLYDFMVIEDALDPTAENLGRPMSRFACRKLAIAACPNEFIPEQIRKGFAPDNDMASDIQWDARDDDVRSRMAALKLSEATLAESDKLTVAAGVILDLISEDDQRAMGTSTVAPSKTLVITPSDRYSGLLLDKVSRGAAARDLRVPGGMIHSMLGSSETDMRTFLSGAYRFAMGALTGQELPEAMPLDRIVLTEDLPRNQLWSIVGASMKTKPTPAQLVDLGESLLASGLIPSGLGTQGIEPLFES